MKKVLIGDFGGTNIRLQLYGVHGADIIEKTDFFFTDEYRSCPVDCIKVFLSGLPVPDIAVFGVTGIVKNNKILASFAYGTDTLSGNIISEATGIPEVYLLNDLEVSGYGICSLSPSETHEINGGVIEETGPIVGVSIGTGVGTCYLIHNQHNYFVFPAEGGSQDYTPKTHQDKKLYLYLSERYNKPGINYNSMLAGSCCHILYEFLREENPELVNPEFDQIFMESDKEKTKIMMQAGFGKKDELAKNAVEIWEKAVGSLLSNMYLNFIPTGGIYLYGGVIAKNYEEIIRSKTIRMGFYMGRSNIFHKAMKKIPIFVVNPEEIGLRGALFYAKQKLRLYLQ